MKEVLRSFSVIRDLDHLIAALNAEKLFGAITEISGEQGFGKTRLVVDLIAQNSKYRVAWIEDDFTVYPYSLFQSGLNAEQVFFVDSGDEYLWSLFQVLSSQLFRIVVISISVALKELELRRIQLAAEKAGSAVIVLSKKTHAMLGL